jgi:hypothetical protein
LEFLAFSNIAEPLTNNHQKIGIGYAYLLLFAEYDPKLLTFSSGKSGLFANHLRSMEISFMKEKLQHSRAIKTDNFPSPHLLVNGLGRFRIRSVRLIRAQLVWHTRFGGYPGSSDFVLDSCLTQL